MEPKTAIVDDIRADLGKEIAFDHTEETIHTGKFLTYKLFRIPRKDGSSCSWEFVTRPWIEGKPLEDAIVGVISLL